MSNTIENYGVKDIKTLEGIEGQFDLVQVCISARLDRPVFSILHWKLFPIVWMNI